MTSSTVKKQQKRKTSQNAPTTECFRTAVDGFQGGPEAIRAVVDQAGRLNVRAPDMLRSMARSVFDKALRSKTEELKGFAVLARRLSDRLPRTGTPGSGDMLSFAAALYELCASEFERLSSLHPRDLSSCQGSNDENQENDVHQQIPELSDTVDRSVQCSVEGKCSNVCPRPAPGDPPGHDQEAIKHLMTLQLFSACLYTQDVVPEDFVHKQLDFHRFSGSSWPSELRFAGIGSTVEMLSFCGKRLERLGSLKHVMPDFYTFLTDVARDPACPHDLNSQIFNALRLRANGWMVETREDLDPLALHDPPTLGS